MGWSREWVSQRGWGVRGVDGGLYAPFTRIPKTMTALLLGTKQHSGGDTVGDFVLATRQVLLINQY